MTAYDFVGFVIAMTAIALVIAIAHADKIADWWERRDRIQDLKDWWRWRHRGGRRK